MFCYNKAMREFYISAVAAAMLYFPYIWCRMRSESAAAYGLEWSINKTSLTYTLAISMLVLFLLTPVAFALNAELPHKRTALDAFNLIASGLAAAVIEETFYRGWLQTLLKRKLSIYVAITIVNILFASSHLILFPNNLWLLTTFFPGLIMSFLREKFDNILPSTIFHFLGNLWAIWFFPL